MPADVVAYERPGGFRQRRSRSAIACVVLAFLGCPLVGGLVLAEALHALGAYLPFKIPAIITLLVFFVPSALVFIGSLVVGRRIALSGGAIGGANYALAAAAVSCFWMLFFIPLLVVTLMGVP